MKPTKPPKPIKLTFVKDFDKYLPLHSSVAKYENTQSAKSLKANLAILTNKVKDGINSYFGDIEVNSEKKTI